jgi:cell division protein FtsZ
MLSVYVMDLDSLDKPAVTKPFDFEGKRRMRIADEGLALLQEEVDTLIVIPNQKVISSSTSEQTYVPRQRTLRAGAVDASSNSTQP